MFKKKVLLALCLVTLLLVACSEDLVNGQNWYCPSHGYLDMVTTAPPLSARISCQNPKFEAIFGVPDDEDLLDQIRELSNVRNWGSLGVIVENDQIVLLYINWDNWPLGHGITTYWRAGADK